MADETANIRHHVIFFNPAAGPNQLKCRPEDTVVWVSVSGKRILKLVLPDCFVAPVQTGVIEDKMASVTYVVAAKPPKNYPNSFEVEGELPGWARYGTINPGGR